MYQAPTRPLTIGEALDDGLRIYRETFTRVWLYALLAGVAWLPATFAANQMDPNDPSLTSVVLLFVTGIVFTLSSFVFLSMLIARMQSIVAGDTMSFGAAAARGLRRAPAYIVAGILYGLMIMLAMFMAIMITALIAGVLVGAFGMTDDAVLGPILIALIAILIALVPTAYLSITFYFYNYAAVLDGKGPFAALGYSVRLITGNWWRTAGILTIAVFIIGVAYIVVIVIAGAVEISTLTGTALPGWIGPVLDYIIAPLFQVLLLPLFYALPLAVYNDLKLRREGSDLAARIAAVDL